ncbi:hypothetical protein CFC21_062368 [Triticum aestivum]|uniref:Inositol polyphosphate-related phosphatase domain-containing protein n=6 Tax=Triticinae TaxID=1648030 RepID=A0A453IJY2_AEGTS|nr:type IV inositol polyphosphate 5-phosphatase 9 [Aegilops tauschii subsp. strangulata]XP_044378015.1 type IV inositol polyphosphate 5-phosphatase 9-like [Triticum aestivum]KAF7054741.1 hypothetical protein CFC21_062368 [Triticum aestivum]
MLENQSQAEVLWPRLVANKLFRKPSGSHAFVADFPAAAGAAEEEFDGCGSPDADAQRCVKRPRPQQRNKTLKYRLFASTWNVGGVAPPDDLDLSDWLDTRNGTYDIYVLGFQEVVPLRARNVLGADKNRIGMRWNELVRAALNRSSPSPSPGATGGGEKQKVHPVRDGAGGLQSRDFRCVVSKQMVGILLTVWVRGDLRRFVRRPSVSCVGCGVMGCLGNKGAVSVRFWLRDTSFCFVCCHLASGGREGDEAHRNADAAEILRRTSFPRRHCSSSSPSLATPHKILDHDRVILLGDLNYRISLPEAKTRLLVERHDWKTLLDNDQLRGEVSSEGGTFNGWNEGAITFSPTYKYHRNSDAYYGCAQLGSKGDKLKRRAPAWCDRVLWRGAGLRQTRYDRCESRLSDHRPVRAAFAVEVDAPWNLNSLRSFFLSERFDDRAKGPADGLFLLREDDHTAASARYAEDV